MIIGRPDRHRRSTAASQTLLFGGPPIATDVTDEPPAADQASTPTLDPDPDPDPGPDPNASATPERRLDSAFGHGALAREDARRDVATRRWNVVSPAATQIGRARDGDVEPGERIRRLHDERHPAMAGHGERAHRLDRLRIAQALCNSLDVTPWQRDRVLGIMDAIDLRAFGSQRSVPKVALVVIRHVVDVERRRYLGLEDRDYIARLSPDEMADRYEMFTSITDEAAFDRLLERHDLTTTSLNRLRRVLVEQLEEHGVEWAVYGRNPYRDPNLPQLADRRDGGADVDGPT